MHSLPLGQYQKALHQYTNSQESLPVGQMVQGAALTGALDGNAGGGVTSHTHWLCVEWLTASSLLVPLCYQWNLLNGWGGYDCLLHKTFPSCSAWSAALVELLPLLQDIYPCSNTPNINEQAGCERLKAINGKEWACTSSTLLLHSHYCCFLQTQRA